MLTWQITAQWQYDPAFSTEIEVQFLADGPRRTRALLEHRQLERYAADAETMTKTFEADDAWAASLQTFAGASARGKFLMIYETTPEGLARARDHLPAHRDRLDEFHARGAMLMAGPVMDGSGRAFGVFTTREAAEQFIAGDPFIIHQSSRAGRSRSGTRSCSDRHRPALVADPARFRPGAAWPHAPGSHASSAPYDLGQPLPSILVYWSDHFVVRYGSAPSRSRPTP